MMLNIKSFHSFRNANRQTRLILNEIPQYRQVVQHSSEGIKALARTALSRHVTYQDLYHALINGECTLCGEFGGLLFFLTCTRCCYHCLREKLELAVVEGDDIYCPDAMKVERGVSCKGCEKAFVGERFEAAGQGWVRSDIPSDCVDRDLSFSAVGFQKHFESCEHA
ncbi:hypothetical protein ACHAPD_010282 [Fusarium lateritium]